MLILIVLNLLLCGMANKNIISAFNAVFSAIVCLQDFPSDCPDDEVCSYLSSSIDYLKNLSNRLVEIYLDSVNSICDGK